MSAPIPGNFDLSRMMEVVAMAEHAWATAPHRSRWWKFKRWLSRHIRAPFVWASVIAENWRDFINSPSEPMTAEDQALANIAACHEALKAFEPIATPEFMRDLRAAVDKHEAAVRKVNGLGQQEPDDVLNPSMDKPPERAPLLSASMVHRAAGALKDRIEAKHAMNVYGPEGVYVIGAKEAIDFYEAKITSGELIVASEVNIVETLEDFEKRLRRSTGE